MTEAPYWVFGSFALLGLVGQRFIPMWLKWFEAKQARELLERAHQMLEQRLIGPRDLRRLGLGLPLAREEGEFVSTVLDQTSSQDPSVGSAEADRYDALLLSYYAHALAQARRSFGASLYCSVLGGVVLIAGVALAIFRSDTQLASVTTTVAGVLTTSLSALFGRQAASAREHIEGQTKLLRQDMKAERDLNEALKLLWKISDETARNRLLVGLVMKMSGSKLPDMAEFSSASDTKIVLPEQSPSS
jgi:hypothetical protein